MVGISVGMAAQKATVASPFCKFQNHHIISHLISEQVQYNCFMVSFAFISCVPSYHVSALAAVAIVVAVPVVAFVLVLAARFLLNITTWFCACPCSCYLLLSLVISCFFLFLIFFVAVVCGADCYKQLHLGPHFSRPEDPIEGMRRWMAVHWHPWSASKVKGRLHRLA